MRQYVIWAGVAAVLLTFAIVAVSRLKPAAPTVDRSTIWPDTVKRGDLTFRCAGQLGRWCHGKTLFELIPAQTDATVVRIRALPGAIVTPDTILMDLSDPQLEQQLTNAKLQLQQAQADYKSEQATLQSQIMTLKTTLAQVDADYATGPRPTRTSSSANWA